MGVKERRVFIITFLFKSWRCQPFLSTRRSSARSSACLGSASNFQPLESTRMRRLRISPSVLISLSSRPTLYVFISKAFFKFLLQPMELIFCGCTHIVIFMNKCVDLPDGMIVQARICLTPDESTTPQLLCDELLPLHRCFSGANRRRLSFPTVSLSPGSMSSAGSCTDTSLVTRALKKARLDSFNRMHCLPLP